MSRITIDDLDAKGERKGMKQLPPSPPDDMDAEAAQIAPRGRKRDGITLDDVVPLREKGLSFAQIGRLLGVSKQAVHQVFDKHGFDAGTVERFRANRGAILADLQRRLLKSMTDAEVKRMAPRDRVVALGICFDKERLETGQSTFNLSSFSALVQRAEEMEIERFKRIAEARKKPGWKDEEV